MRASAKDVQRGFREGSDGLPGSRFSERLGRVLPGAYALLAPFLFLPGSLVDAYVLPRTALALAFGSGMAGVVVGWRRVRDPGLLGWAGGGVVVAAAVAAAFSVNPWLSLVGAYTRYESLAVRLAYLGLFAGAAALPRGPAAAPARRLVVHGFVVGSSVAAVEAAWQLLNHSLARPDGNLGQPNLLGAVLAMAIPLSLQAAFRFWPWAGTLPVLCLGLYASSSRSGWIAALVGCLVVLVAALPARVRRPGAVLAVVAVAGALAVLLLSPLRSLNNDTGGARIGVWRDGINMALARPATGWGEDTTGLVFGRFQTRDWEPGDTFDRLHDQPLDLLVTQGLFGLMACGLFWGFTLWRCAGALRGGRGGAAALKVGAPLGAVVAYMAWSLLNFDWAPATGPAWLLLGLAWAEAEAEAADGGRPGAGTGAGAGAAPAWPAVLARARLPRPAAPAAGVALGFAGLLLAGEAVAADHAYYTGATRDAVFLAPLAARYHRVLGEAIGHSPAALAELERARALGEYDYQFFIELGDTARDLGRLPEARAAYRRAHELYRFDATADERLASLGGP